MTVASRPVCRVDTSATGSLVACSCGYVVGPFAAEESARADANRHRNVHAEERKARARRG